jgi:hypothetical protein
MSFMDRAKDLLDQHDDKVDQALDKVGEMAKQRFAGHDAQIDGLIDQAQQRTGAGDTTQPAAAQPGTAQPGTALPDTGPGTADGGPAEEQQLEPHGDQGGAVEHAPEVPGGPGPDVPAGPGHVPPQQ